MGDEDPRSHLARFLSLGSLEGDAVSGENSESARFERTRATSTHLTYVAPFAV